MGIKKSLKGKKRSSTVGDITFSSSSDESDQANKKRKLTDDRIPDTQTMVGQLQKLDLSPAQMENVLKANRKGRDRLSLKRKAHDAVGHHEINTSSKNDFISPMIHFLYYNCLKKTRIVKASYILLHLCKKEEKI